MDDIPEQSVLHVVSLSAQADDRWRLRGRCIEKVRSEHLGPTAAFMARRRGRMLRLSERGRIVHDRLLAASEIACPAPPTRCRSGRGRPLVRASSSASSGSRAVRAGRVRSGRRSGRSASPDRVSSEVGSARSCVGVVGGHTPLQVPLWGTFASLRGHGRGRRASDSTPSGSGQSCD